MSRREGVVGGDQRSQILAEQQIDGWAVVHCADADGKEVGRQARGLIGKERQQLWRQLSRREDSGSAGGEPDVAVRLPVVDRRECLEDGGDEHRAEGMRFDFFAVDGTGRAHLTAGWRVARRAAGRLPHRAEGAP